MTEDQDAVALALGRCVLGMQRLELAMKALLTGHRGSFIDKAFYREPMDRKTLGQLAGLLTGSVLASAAAEDDGEDSEAVPGARFRIGLAEEDLAWFQTELPALVEDRNHVVHHFLQTHDLATPEGCRAALAALEALTARRRGLEARVRELLQHKAEMVRLLSDPAMRERLARGDPG